VNWKKARIILKNVDNVKKIIV